MLGLIQVVYDAPCCQWVDHVMFTIAEEYEASIYMLGIECGEVQFCSPLVDGSYTISAVRDLKILYRCVPRLRIGCTEVEQYLQLAAIPVDMLCVQEPATWGQEKGASKPT